MIPVVNEDGVDIDDRKTGDDGYLSELKFGVFHGRERFGGNALHGISTNIRLILKCLSALCCITIAIMVHWQQFYPPW